MLQSYLNMLKVIQNTNGGGGGGDKEESLKFQIKVKTVVDEDVVQKVNKGGTIIYFFGGDRFLVFMHYSRKCSIKAPAIDCKTSIYVLKEIFFEII